MRAAHEESVELGLERGLLLVQGAVPGHREGRLVVTPAAKARKTAGANG